MRVVGRVRGDLGGLLDGLSGEIADAARMAVSSAAQAVQAELRSQVRAAGLGAGLEKAWRLEVYPRARRRTTHPAALVFSKATRLHEAFDRGGTITARRARWLVLPLPAAVAAGADRLPARKGAATGGPVPAKWSAVRRATERYGELRFVPLEGGRALLVADGRARGDRIGKGRTGRAVSVPVFLLVRHVRQRKTLDLAAATAMAETLLARNLSNILGALR